MFPESCFLSLRFVVLSVFVTLALPLQAGEWDLGDSAIAQLESFHEGMAAFKIRGQWGFVDRDGKVAVEPQFDEVVAFSEGLAAVSSEEKWGFVDRMGKLKIPVKFSYVRDFQEGLAGAEDENGNWGYLAPDGHWALPPKFARAESFVAGYALVEEVLGRYLLIDKAGNTVKRFPAEFDVARKSRVLVATRKPLPVLVTVDGQISPLPADAENTGEADTGLRVASELINDELRYGAKDRDGQWVIAPGFARMGDFNAGLAIAGSEGALGLVDKTGQFVVQPVYQEITAIAGGRYLARGETSSPHLDVFDRQGRMLFSNPCGRLEQQQSGPWTIFEGCDALWVMDRHERMYRFSIGQPEIAHAGEYLLIQSTAGKLVDGRLITPFSLLGPEGVVMSSEAPEIAKQYDWAMLIEGSDESTDDPLRLLPLAMLVRRDGGVAIVTRDHRIVHRAEWRYDPLLLEYNRPSGRVNGPMIMKTADAWGAIDAQGEWVVRPALERLHAFTNDIALARRDGQDVVYGRRGKHRELPAGFRLSERLGTERFVLEGRNEAGEKRRIETDLVTGEERGYVVDSRFRDDGHGSLSPADDQGRWGLIDAAGQWVVPPDYESRPEALLWKAKPIGWKICRPASEGGSGSQRLCGLLSPTGKETVKPVFESIWVYEQTGLLETTNRHGGQKGLMRADGREILPAAYSQITYLEDGKFRAEPGEQKGLMNARGEWILEPGPYKLHDLGHRPYSRERLGDEDAYVDIAGRISTPSKPLAPLDDNPDYWERREEQDKSGKSFSVYYGFDWKTRVRLPEDADGNFFGGFLSFSEYHQGASRMRLADSRGKLIKLNYESVGTMNDGLAVIKQAIGKGSEARERYGYIDRQGKARIAPLYEQAGDFSERRAAVVLKGNYGVIDDQGRLILHSAWLCGQYPVLLDGRQQIIWPTSGLQACDRPGEGK